MNILTTSIMDLERDRNGVVSVAQELNHLLREAGHRVDTLTPANGKGIAVGRFASRLARVTSYLHRVAGSPAWFLVGLRLSVWALERRCKTQAISCDAVIAHDPLTAGAALHGAGGRVPVLLFCHFWTEPWLEFSAAGLLPSGSAPFRQLQRMMTDTLNDPRVTLVPVSARNATLVRQIAPHAGARIMTAYPGVASLRPANRVERGDQALPVIINVGKIERRKNQRILPAVAVELRRLGRPCRFVLVGPEEREESAFIRAEISAQGVDDLFTLTGPLERDAVMKALSGADLYLHASVSESFGMTLVEAMVAGTAVMALEYEALNEILPDTPEAVIPAEAAPADIALKLAEALADRTCLAEMTRRQAAVFEARFTSRAFCGRVLEIIEAARAAHG
jgi:glycosyltransferase involved in cell wall biosynthesis